MPASTPPRPSGGARDLAQDKADERNAETIGETIVVGGKRGGSDDAAEVEVDVSQSLPVERGSVVAEKYRLERALRHGSMGSVWVARHLALDTLVAIKFMSHHGVASSGSGARSVESRMRFEREAKAAAQIRGANVVQILDYGIDRQTPYIVMELLRGEDLGARLRRVERLPLDEVATIMTAIARALDAAHAVGLVHRDLKPANIFLAREGEEETPKVLDFGVAKATRRDLATGDQTLEGQLVGTLSYMSPEQTMAGAPIDHRSDIWAMGVIAFRALTGAKPFPAEPVFEAIEQIRKAAPPLATDLVPSLAPGIDGFFSQALERDASKRFQSAKALARALRALVPGAPGSVSPSSPSDSLAGARQAPGESRSSLPAARTSAPSISSPRPSASTLHQSTSSIPVQPRRAPGVVPLAAAVALAVTVVVVLVARSRRAPDAPAGPASSEATPLADAPSVRRPAPVPVPAPASAEPPSAETGSAVAAPSAEPPALRAPPRVRRWDRPAVPKANPSARPSQDVDLGY
jgi:serine/threonine protein kinase